MVMSALNCVMRINRWLQLDKGTSGTLQVVNPHLWQPGEGYLYELYVTAKSRTECDIYPLRVGIRSVAVKGEQFLINLNRSTLLALAVMKMRICAAKDSITC